MAVGCYPGSFNPPTVAHLAVADAGRRQAGLARVDLVLSREALGKPAGVGPSVEERRAVLQTVAAARPWLGVVVTDARLIADIAAGYDAVLLGADKWAQVLDPAWYGSVAARDAALAGLPRVLVAPRAGDRPAASDRPAAGDRPAWVELLEVPDHIADVSASAIRAGHEGAGAWILPEASASGLWS